ncbi:transposase [Salinibacter ruber]|uniref:transposase n=1 Tax=Salinibacter ruber TaxID=146919 RepID=UPI003C6DEF39
MSLAGISLQIPPEFGHRGASSVCAQKCPVAKAHALVHRPTQIVIAAMLLPGNRSDQVAARGLARSTSGGVLLTDEGYRGEELFNWPCGQAQTLRTGAVSRASRQAGSSFSGLWRRLSNRVCARSWHGP